MPSIIIVIYALDPQFEQIIETRDFDSLTPEEKEEVMERAYDPLNILKGVWGLDCPNLGNYNDIPPIAP